MSVDDEDPALTTIGVHIARTTRLRARPVSCHRAAVQIGGRTEVAVFLDRAGIDRLTLALAEARELLDGPSQLAAA